MTQSRNRADSTPPNAAIPSQNNKKAKAYQRFFTMIAHNEKSIFSIKKKKRLKAFEYIPKMNLYMMIKEIIGKKKKKKKSGWSLMYDRSI